MRPVFIVFLQFRRIAFWLFLIAAVLLDLAAHAGEHGRTASWYAAHPAQMRAMVSACRDDPGHGWNHPDCMNARGGEIREAEAEGRRHTGLIPPTNPAYWRGNPDLSRQLFVCSLLAPADQGPAFCPAARAAAP